MDKWSKKLLGGMGGILILVLLASTAMAQGNFYIPGSGDNTGGLGEDGKSFNILHINNTVTFEGTSDAYEGRLISPDVGTDTDWQLPATAGTLSLSGATPVGATLTDAKILIGNSAGTAVEVTPSGDWTITNAGVSSLASNSVGTNEAYVNTVSVTIPATSTQGTATVTTGSTLLGAPYGVANIHFLALNGITNVTIVGTTLTLITNGTTGANAVVYKQVVLEP